MSRSILAAGGAAASDRSNVLGNNEPSTIVVGAPPRDGGMELTRRTRTMRIQLIRPARIAVIGGALLAVVVAAPTFGVSATWTRQFGTVAEDLAGGIAQDAGGFTVVGTTGGPLVHAVKGANDGFIRRYDRSGKLLWTRQFGTGGQDMGIDVAADSAGLTVVGVTDGSFSGGATTPGTDDLFIRRYNRTGTHLWTRQFGTSSDEDGGSIAADASGIIVVGTTWGTLAGSSPTGDADPIVRKYDRSGNVLWTKQFGTVEADTADAVAIDGAGFTVAGGTDGDLAKKNAGPFTDMYVRRFDATGKALWTRQWGQKGDDQALSIAADGTGVTAVGYTHADAFGNASSQAFIRRWDRTGTLVFARIFGSVDSEIAWGVAADNAAITVTGYTYGSMDAQNKGTFDVFVRRYDRAGNVVWKRQFGTGQADLGIDVAADSTGFTILGHTQGNIAASPKGELDIFVRRYTR
jgi:hypothetical protein